MAGLRGVMATMNAIVGLSHLLSGSDNKTLTRRSPMATAWRHLDREIDRYIDHGLAAAWA